MKTTKSKTLYKFLRTGLKSDHGFGSPSRETGWQVGEWKKQESAECCASGFHASKTPLQAFGYVKGEVLAEVEVRGISDIQDDKEAWSEMRVVRAWHWTANDSVDLAIFAAEQVIEIYEKNYPTDDRPRKAIEAAKAYLKVVREGGDTKAADAAADAADAARAAARAADAAARAADAADAAADAADAADAAAYAAAYAADAARAARAADAAARAAARAAAYAADAARAAAYAADAARKELVAKIDAWFLVKLETLKPYEDNA